VKRQKSLHVDNPVAVGSRVRTAREQAGLSQVELAGGDCSAAYISRIELGDRTPSLQLLRELSKRLGVSADYLASGSVVGEGECSPLREAELALRLDDLDDARRLYESVLASDGATGERFEALAGLGQLAHREGRYRDAIQLFEEAIESGGLDPATRPQIAEGLARAYAETGEPAQAVALLSRCVERYAAEEDILQYIRFAALLGYALTDTGDLRGAERVVSEALVAGRDVADPYARARLYWSQSRLLAEQGKPAAAERYARKTIETLRVTEDTYAIAHALQMLAHIYNDLGRPHDALELLVEEQPLIEASGTPTEIVHYQLEKTFALAALGEKEEAAAMAMTIAGQLAEVKPVSRGRAYALLADLFRGLGDLDRAAELYELGLELLEQQAPSKYLTSAYRGLAEILKEQGRRDEAFELLERALNVQERIGLVSTP
jgi:tetratricopeptide (TPR) repeat protein/DNA-binding XRE family transcriptional regulator